MTFSIQGQIDAQQAYADQMQHAARVFDTEGASAAYYASLEKAEEHYDHFRFFNGDYD